MKPRETANIWQFKWIKINLYLLQVLPAGLDKSLLMKNGKILPEEAIDYSNLTNLNKLSNQNQSSITDNLTESESLEQDGVLVVNISSDNILNLDELYPNIPLFNYSNKMEEVTNKIQSNSREITGDSNNIKFRNIPENITVAPAPTNGVIANNEQNEDNESIYKSTIKQTNRGVFKQAYIANDVVKPTESLQSLIDNSTSHRRRRRRRHGNGRR